MQAENHVCLRNACANAIQTKPHRLKLLILYNEKISQNKSSKFRKMEKQATFLTLGTNDLNMHFVYFYILCPSLGRSEAEP